MYDAVLTEEAAALVPGLARFKEFYLVGGTALALQIGHRRSVDFDLFTAQALPARLLERVKQAMAPHRVLVTYRSPEQFNFIINQVKVTFFAYPYQLVESLGEYRGLSLVTVAEVAAMKAFSIGKRLSYKDYVDWYFMLKGGHVSLADTIRLASRKFGSDFNDRLFLGQLVSLEDVPTQTIDFLSSPVERQEIEDFLNQAVKNFNL